MRKLLLLLLLIPCSVLADGFPKIPALEFTVEDVLRAKEDMPLIAACVALESVGEGREGMEAVAEVMVRRAEQAGTTITRQLLTDRQFSAFNGLTRGRSSRAQVLVKARRISGGRWPVVLEVADKAVTRRLPIRVPNATYYYDYKIVSPSWANKMVQVAIIGNHRFMRTRGS